jgi:hypothetical protein
MNAAAYQKDNVVVKDGKLTLEGRFEKVYAALAYTCTLVLQLSFVVQQLSYRSTC